MKNPFIYGTVVTGKNFTNRKKEIRELINDIKSGQNIFLFSPRRYGKTSLIKVIQNKLKNENFITIYVDFYQVYSRARFIELYARAIAKETGTKLEKIIEFFKKNVRNIVPSVSLDSSGSPVFKMEYINNKKNETYILDDILQLPYKLAKKNKKNMVIVFDEFQEITNLNGDSFEKELRANIQYHEEISYIFMGSKTHILQNMFTDKNRALYKIGKIYPLKKIPRDELVKFILNRFNEGDYSINNNIAEKICRITENYPYYLQMLCHEIWEVAIENKIIDKDVIQIAVNNILNNQSELFLKMWEILSNNQKALLAAFINSGVEEIYSNQYRENNHLPPPSSVQRSVKGLIEKGIIEAINNKLEFSDIFFRLWVKSIL